MRTTYLLDSVRRRKAGAAGVANARSAESEASALRRRKWMAAAALLCVGLAAAGWALRAPSGRTGAPAPGSAASVPAHQWSGQLANPYGGGPAVAGEGGAEAAASAAGGGNPGNSAASAAGTAAPGPQAPAALPATTFTTPAARQAVAAALARWRAAPRGGEFMAQTLQGSEPAALLVAWMADRQCRQVTQWRLVTEWRYRAITPGARTAEPTPPAPLPTTTSTSLRSLASRCVDMPEESQVDAALARAGFAATDLPEPTRRPLDLSAATALGEPAVLATVLDATSPEDLVAWMAARTRNPGAAGPQTSFEVLRAALWLASCQGTSAGGGGGGAARPACQDHPAVWQACTQQGLCDGRDLHDVLLRTLPTDVWHASDRLARDLAPLLGR